MFFTEKSWKTKFLTVSTLPGNKNSYLEFCEASIEVDFISGFTFTLFLRKNQFFGSRIAFNVSNWHEQFVHERKQFGIYIWVRDI